MLNIKYSYPGHLAYYQYTMSCIDMHAWLWWYWVVWLPVITEIITQNCRLVLQNTNMYQILGSRNLNIFFLKIFIFIYTIQSSVIYCWIRIIIKTKRKKPTFLSFSLRSHISVNYDFNAMNRGTCKCFVSLFLLWVKRTLVSNLIVIELMIWQILVTSFEIANLFWGNFFSIKHKKV